MSTITFQAEINEIDFPIFQALFNRFKIEPTILKKKKKDLPVETATANEETMTSFEESEVFIQQYRKGLVKGYTDVKQMFEDIDNE